jgi:hypothetical protein
MILAQLRAKGCRPRSRLELAPERGWWITSSYICRWKHPNQSLPESVLGASGGT